MMASSAAHGWKGLAQGDAIMWPFGRKHPGIDSLPPIADEGQLWTVATGHLDGSPIIVRLNEAARLWRGHPGLPVKLGFAVPLNSPVEGGLPTTEEHERLIGIEGIVVREVGARTRALHAMTLTTGVMKEFVFYIPTGVDIGAIHRAVQTAVDSHEVQCMAVMEPRWESFRRFGGR